MTIPTMTFVDGQGGNISINGVILQPTQYRIGKQFTNANTTTTGSGGWQQRTRVMAGWGFQAHLFFDAAHIPDGVQLVSGIYVPIGIEAATAGSQGLALPCIFQIGASGWQYQGYALLSSNSPGIQAEGVVDLEIEGTGTGALIGPVAGQIS